MRILSFTGLVILVSSQGETMILSQPLEWLKERGAETLSIVNVKARLSQRGV